ncbi:27bb80b1-1014-45ba-b952-cc415e2bc95f [Thermothielavioides terrestris]|uniref:RAD52 homolog n=1 Tax=Thermothielavioides terrestris TaxID=2587410 RepID=A0A446BEQ5_9PEZI|nr:27bb80b1-1014-45ba-b952-cc415e2bc95f [Thermothielavioides terrestris]
MPAPGDQHTSIANPFAEPQQRISEYTAQEIATLQSRLEKQLGPEYLSTRSGPSGQKVHYITAEKCIALANEVFGFNGWSSSIQNIQVDFVEEHPQTLRVNIGLSVIVRVTLRDGTYHEDLGYGHTENCKGKAAAFEKAKKEGTTDALKRALRHFGNVLGNCIYDKAYLAKVTKMKVAHPKFDETGLHRHPDFVVKKEPVDGETSKEKGAPPAPPPQYSDFSFEDFLGELDEADFNISEEGHPDEVLLPNSNETDSNQSNASNRNHHQPDNGGNSSMQPPGRQLARTASAGNNPPRQAPQTPVQQPPRPNTNSFPGAQSKGPPAAAPPQQQFNQNRPAPQPNHANQTPNPQAQMTPPPAAGVNAAAPGGEPVGFLTSKAVKLLSEEEIIKGAIAPIAGQVFNPRLESPSIRRTPGIDHSVTKPLSKSGKHVPPKNHVDPDDATDPDTAAFSKKPTSAPGQQQRPPPPPAPPPQQQQQQQHHQLQQNQPPGGAGPARPAGGPPGRPTNVNVVNPQLDQTRKIGAPVVSSSPIGNRGQFRPPTVKRPAAGDLPTGPPGAKTSGGAGATNPRVPLGDVSNSSVRGNDGGADAGPGGPEVKRQRIS